MKNSITVKNWETPEFQCFVPSFHNFQEIMQVSRNLILLYFCTIDMPYHYRYHITQLRHHYPWNCKHSSLFLVFSLRKYQNLFNRKHMCLRKMLCLSILSLLYVSNHNAVILVLHNVQPKNPRDNWMSSKSGIGTQVVWYYVYFCLRIQ